MRFTPHAPCEDQRILIAELCRFLGRPVERPRTETEATHVIEDLRWLERKKKRSAQRAGVRP